MPERHAAEHQDDDRDDDPEIEEEVWDEGIHGVDYRVDLLIGWPVGRRETISWPVDKWASGQGRQSPN
jgi:hypothetical protein